MKPARSGCEAQREAAFGGARFPVHPQERHFRRGIECTLARPAVCVVVGRLMGPW